MARVRLFIDDRPIEVEAGTTLLAALLKAGCDVPHPCHHPALSAPGSCRLCVASLEVEAGSTLITTCNRTAREGLRLSTQTPQVQAARRQLVDDLLRRHPPACPVCERAGECELQELAQAHGDGQGDVDAIAAGPRARVELGPRLVLDRDRCILCTRCVRFAEVSGVHDLSVCGSGVEAQITASGVVDHPLSGNLIDLCPAGALVEPEERLAPPAWRLTGSRSVCAGCASGCVTRVDAADGRVWRVRPAGDGDDAQGYWLCDEGRYGWRLEGERLTTPRRADEPVEWDAVFADVAERLERAPEAAVLLGPYLSNEEALLLLELADRWEADAYIWQARHPDGDRVFPSGFTIRARRGPNGDGVAAVAGVLERRLGSVDDLRARLADGRLGALYAVGGALEHDGPVLDLPPTTFLAVHDLRPSPLAARADVVLPGGSAWTEKEGTFVDATGRLQRVRAVEVPPDGARPDFWILSALWHGGPNRDAPEPVFARLARAATGPPFAGYDYARLTRESGPATGVAFGGGWTSHLQRRGLIQVEDHGRRS